MMLLSLLILSLVYTHASASFPDSYDSRLRELPHRVSQLVPEGLPWSLLRYYCPLQATSSNCLRDARMYLSGLQTFQPWALQMLDASSKLPSGLMMGHIHDLGNYDECFSEMSAPFLTQFCVIDLLNVISPPRLVHPNAETTLGGLPLLKDPKASFCLPASCTESDVATHFSYIAASWNMSVRVNRYSCSRLDTTPFDALDWMAIAVLCTLTLLVTLSTGYEIFCSHKEGSRSCNVLLSFSLVTNSRRLFSTVDPAQSLAFLGGLRFISIIWVILGHHALLQFLIPSINWIVPYKEMPKPMFSPLQNAMLAVDTFLVITGALIAYFFLQEIGTNQRPFKLVPFYFHRVIRVTPTLAILILLAATLSARIGNGPLWHTFYTRHQEDCRRNGWTNMLYLNNYIHTDNQCCSFTWYLCVDMQLYLLSPLILFPLLRHRVFAWVGLPVLTLAAITTDYLVAYLNKLPAGSLITRDLRTADNYRLEYTKTHTRVAPWLIGIGLGYILHSLKGTKFKLSQGAAVFCWVAAAALMIFSVFGVSYFHQDDQVLNYNALQSSFYISLHRVAWAVGISWLFFACETGHAGPVRTFLASRVFQPLGRLSFSLYMVHGGIQYAMVASQKSPVYFSPIFVVRDVLGELVLAVGQAIILSLGVEAPLIRLEKALFQNVTEKIPDEPEKKEITLNGASMEVTRNMNNEEAERTRSYAGGGCDNECFESRL